MVQRDGSTFYHSSNFPPDRDRNVSEDLLHESSHDISSPTMDCDNNSPKRKRKEKKGTKTAPWHQRFSPPDDKNAILVSSELHYTYFVFTWSSKTTAAALRPGAPITPPPGCAPLPQRYSPFTGVL